MQQHSNQASSAIREEKISRSAPPAPEPLATANLSLNREEETQEAIPAPACPVHSYTEWDPL